jgi:hypothetical protein
MLSGIAFVLRCVSFSGATLKRLQLNPSGDQVRAHTLPDIIFMLTSSCHVLVLQAALMPLFLAPASPTASCLAGRL